jgi:nicotinamidase-related amidase
MKATASSERENVPDRSPVALLLVDVMNDLEFPGGDLLLTQALPMARAILELKGRARAAGVPCIYANDNFGRWRSDFREIVRHVREDGVRGRPVADTLRPDHDDYFVLKPRHSAFFGTSLELLLEYIGARTLVITGMAGNNCVVASATDAYMRGYRIVVPPDAIASERRELNEAALEHMRTVLKAQTPCAAEIDFAALGEDQADSAR